MGQLTALLPIVLLPVLAAQTPDQTPPTKTPPELGTVAWARDLDAALAASSSSGKPVFLLFQEIPGCATCTGFGRHVLGHALLVPAIEECFVPVVIRNNVDGKEGEWRERFAEPAWNNPVVRFLEGSGKDVLPRRDGVHDAHGIARRMVECLQAKGRPVPGHLQVALAESDAKTATAVFAMHCFWEGEAVLGALDGVVRTHAAFVDGAEVVEVTFRPAVLSREALTALAQGKSCKPVEAKSVTPAPANDQQHALGGTPYAKLDLTPMQRTKVHAALTLGGDANAWLTPSQLAMLPKPSPRK